MASDMVTLIVPGLLEQVPVIRHWLRSVLAEWMISAEVIADLALAVTELCTNIITHGYGETAGEIELRLIKYDNILRLTVLDSAPVFVPPQVLPAPSGVLAERGYGLTLVRALVDEFLHQSLGTHGNRVILIKKDVKEA